MAYENLILGILFSIGLFAVKSGLGISYVIAGQQRKHFKVGAFLLFALIYFFVFASAALVLFLIDPVGHWAAMRTFIQSGMTVHVIMAGLMIAWGVLLMKQTHSELQKSKGWLLLAVPCPVCVTVIFFSSGFLIACYPENPKTIVLLLYLVFMTIHLMTVAAVTRWQVKKATRPEQLLGTAMLMIGLYFFTSVTVMPQFADADKIYRMSCYQGDKPAKEVLGRLPFIFIAAMFFVAGYGFRSQKIRNAK